jgi:hypothetical protein
MKYIKLFEEMSNQPQIGDYVMINSYSYYRRIAVVKKIVHDYDPDIMIEVEIDGFLQKYYLNEIKCWGKTIDEVIKNAEKEEKNIKKLCNRLKYNLNKFFDYKTLIGDKLPHDVLLQFTEPIKAKFEDGISPIRVIIPSVYKYYDEAFRKINLYSRLEIYSNKMKKMNLKRHTQDEFYSYNSIKFSKEEAEELLRSIKVEFPMRVVEKEAEKYNM